MRLTLRTLLGWVDGVLPAEEHSAIGEMVAGSRMATRLAEQIREGAACGSTDVPLTGGPAIADDANRVAEYLDNTLLSEHLTAFERLCIESRPHLEEVATCHGILAEISRTPKLARMPRAQRSVLSQRIQRSLSTAAVASSAACADRSDEVSRETVAVEEPAAASHGHADARAAADALVQAMLSKPSRPLKPFRSKEPVRSDSGWQDPVASLVSFLPSRRRSAEPAAREPVAREPAPTGPAAVALAPEPAVPQPAAAAPEQVISPAAAGAVAGSKPTPWAAWVTAALALAVLLAAGGALTSPLRAPKTYAAEPGCMHCTKP
jgi:hypothetical protein